MNTDVFWPLEDRLWIGELGQIYEWKMLEAVGSLGVVYSNNDTGYSLLWSKYRRQ